MAIHGRKALVKVSGAGVAFTDEATTKVTANTVYQITNAAKRVWDRVAAIVVEVDADGAGGGGYAVAAASTYTVNRLTGTITFNSDQGVDAIVRVDGTYLPLSTAAEGRSYAYELSASYPPRPKFGDSAVVRPDRGLLDITGSIGRWYSTDDYFTDALTAGVPVVLEFYSDSTGAFDCRAWAILEKDGIQSVVDGLVEEDVEFVGAADADGRSISG